jgi:hypothetical protein
MPSKETPWWRRSHCFAYQTTYPICGHQNEYSSAFGVNTFLLFEEYWPITLNEGARRLALLLRQ